MLVGQPRPKRLFCRFKKCSTKLWVKKCKYFFKVDRFTTSGFDRVTKIWNRRGECIFTTGSSPTHLIRSSTWVGDGLMLGSENVFQDHVGVVNYDPTYNDTKFSLVVGDRSCVNSVDYCYLHGTLAFCDDLGRAVILSLQNPRRQLNMSRKGFSSKILTKMSVEQKKDSKEYSVTLENYPDLSKIHDSKKGESIDAKKTRRIGQCRTIWKVFTFRNWALSSLKFSLKYNFGHRPN